MSGDHRPAPPDPQDMRGAVRRLPDQIEAMWHRLEGLALPAAGGTTDGVAFIGLGGSAIAGDLVAKLYAAELPVPMVVVRDERLPAWVGRRSLVICSSFSGHTAETLAAFAAAGARRARRVVLTSGGALAQAAAAADVPLVRLPAAGQPRAALGSSLAAVLAVLRATGLIADPSAPLGEGTALMRGLVRQDRENTAAGLAPLSVAQVLAGAIPLVYAPSELAPVARRWKTQLNENAKTMAAFDVLPELDHNSVAGYRFPAGLAAAIHVVILTRSSGSPGLGAAIEATTAELRAQGIRWAVLAAPPGALLAEALWLVQFGDLVSVHLAALHGVDPTAVAALDRVKARRRSEPARRPEKGT